MDCALKIGLYHNGPQHRTKLKQIDRFGDNILKFSEKFDHPFSHVFIFGNMFPENHGFVAMPVTSCIDDISSNLSLSNWWRETKLFDLVTGPTTKPWLSGNMLPNINTCENGWLNFLENLRLCIALILLELTRSASPNQSLYFNFVQYWGSVVMITFLNSLPVLSPLIEKSMIRRNLMLINIPI